MPLIYFLRHGETEWNVMRRMQGHADTPLSDKGRVQAARNGRALAAAISEPSRFDFVSSPLIRATETMEIARREMGLDPKAYRTDPRLREYHMGDWQGLLYDDVCREFPELIAMRDRDPWNFVCPGEKAESYAHLAARVLEWLAEMKSNTVVTSHGGVMRCLRWYFMGIDGAEAYKLDVPQDKVLRIADGELSWL